jgi:hypothetical protein
VLDDPARDDVDHTIGADDHGIGVDCCRKRQEKAQQGNSGTRHGSSR